MPRFKTALYYCYRVSHQPPIACTTGGFDFLTRVNPAQRCAWFCKVTWPPPPPSAQRVAGRQSTLDFSYLTVLQTTFDVSIRITVQLLKNSCCMRSAGIDNFLSSSQSLWNRNIKWNRSTKFLWTDLLQWEWIFSYHYLQKSMVLVVKGLKYMVFIYYQSNLRK